MSNALNCSPVSTKGADRWLVGDPSRKSRSPMVAVPLTTTRESVWRGCTWTPRIVPALDLTTFHCTGSMPMSHSRRKASVKLPRWSECMVSSRTPAPAGSSGRAPGVPDDAPRSVDITPQRYQPYRVCSLAPRGPAPPSAPRRRVDNPSQEEHCPGSPILQEEQERPIDVEGDHVHRHRGRPDDHRGGGGRLPS